MVSDLICPGGVAYFGHDIHDAAVGRRVAMLRAEGLGVRLGGFRRREEEGRDEEGRSIVDLGRTGDARLVQRAIAVARHLLSPRRLRRLSAGAQVLVARNLEMLALAARVRRPGQRLVYECLDIHRLMLGGRGVSVLMRWIERRLLARTDLVIVSSPAFAKDYFRDRQGREVALLLVENKVPDNIGPAAMMSTARPTDARPCVIGWFGMLRCRRTLAQLARIARESGGRVRIVIAGRPSTAQFPEFTRHVAGLPGVTFLGAYGPEDLPWLYGQVDYVWAIDWFEQGLNSDWLLPNRLYEGLAHGVVPIALGHVETGRWLARHGVGLLVEDPARDLPALLPMPGSAGHARLRRAVAGLERGTVCQSVAERRAIVGAIVGADSVEHGGAQCRGGACHGQA